MAPVEAGAPLAALAPTAAPLSAGWHLASGAISGSASVLILQPLDLIKTRLQQDVARPAEPKHLLGLEAVSPLHRSTPQNQPRILATAAGVVRNEGLFGLWRGTVPTLYRNVPGVSMYFLTLTRLRSFVAKSATFRAKGTTAPAPGTKAKLTPAGDLIVGSSARTGVGFVLMPFTLLKTLSESSLALPGSTSQRRSTVGALRSLYANGGLRSLWRGAVPTALRDAPGAGLFIVFYERGRRVLASLGPQATSSGTASGGKKGASSAVGGGVAGAAASLLSTLLTTPFDLLKTRRQVSPLLYPNLTTSVRRVWGERGLRGFWEGGMLRVVRKAGSAGIGWAVYEGVVSFAETRAQDTTRAD